MKTLKILFKSLLPYWLIMKVNSWRGISYLESADIVEIKTNFYRSFLEKGDLVFDVGANYGNRVHIFSLLSCRIVAIEPLKDCCRYLKHQYGDKINVENLCLGSKMGESSLHIGKVNVTSTLSSNFINRTIESGRFSKESWTNTIKVNVSTLDELILKYGVPKYIKIDTEGFELEVIKGLTKRCQFLSFEYTLPEFTSELVEILNELNERGSILINFSVSETMSFGLEKWMELEEFQLFLTNNSKRLGGWGDIYIRYNNVVEK